MQHHQEHHTHACMAGKEKVAEYFYDLFSRSPPLLSASFLLTLAGSAAQSLQVLFPSFILLPVGEVTSQPGSDTENLKP